MSMIAPFPRFQRLSFGLAIIMAILALSSAQAEPVNEEAILEQGGKHAALLVRKARRILAASEVFAMTGVGDGGSPTSSCWALTVLVRYDLMAKEVFNQLLESESAAPEARLYAVAGLISIDPNAKERFAKLSPSELAHLPVHTAGGCSFYRSRFDAEVSQLLSHGAEAYLFRKLPPFSVTCGVTRPASGY